MWKRKKLLFLIIPVLAVGLLFSFRRQVATFAFKSYLGRYVEGAGKCDLTFGEVTWEGKGFTIERFHLEKEGEYELKIRKLHFNFPRDLYLHRPKFKVCKTDGPAIRLKNRRHKGSSGNLIVEKGEIETPLSKAYFAYEDDILRCYFDDSEVLANFSTPQKKEFLTHISTRGADAAWLFGLLYPFVPTHDLELEKGKVKGELDWLVSKKESTAKGAFHFENLSAKRGDMEFFAENLHLLGTWPEAKVELTGGELELLSGNYHFSGLQGRYEQGDALYFSFEGECAHKNLSAPFFVQGQDFGDRLFANLLFDRSSLANIEVKGSDFCNCSIKVESPQILTSHVEWLSPISPLFHEITEGRFSGTVFTQIEQGACKEINACSIKGENFLFRDIEVEELLLTGWISIEKLARSRVKGEFLLKERGEGNFFYEMGEYDLSITAPPDLLVGKEKWTIPSLFLEAKGRIAGELITAKGRAHAGDESVDFSLLYEGDSLRKLSLRSDRISDPFYSYPLSLTGHEIDVKGELALRASFDKEKGTEFELLPIDLTYENEELILQVKGATIPSHFIFEPGKWKSEIILYGSELTEKSRDIHFTGLNGRLFLENGVGYSSWIEGEVEACHIGGELKFKEEQFVFRGKEFRGELSGLLTFLRHFEMFEDLETPLTGKFQSSGDGLTIIQEDEKREIQVAMCVEGGELPLTYDTSAKDLSCKILFDSQKKEFEVQDLTGKLHLFDTPVYGIDGRHLAINDGKLSFDLRVSNHVREIVKLVGSGIAPFSYLIDLDLEQSHLFGERFAKGSLELKPNGKIVALHTTFPLHLESLERQVLAHLPDLKEHRLEGRVDLSLTVEESGQKAALTLFGEKVSILERAYAPFSTLLIKEGKEIHLDHIRLGMHELQGEGEWRADQLDITKIVGFSPQGEITALSGNYNFAKNRGELTFASKNCNLQKVFPVLPCSVDAQAKLHFDLPAKSIEGEMELQSAKSPICFATEEPIQFDYKWREGTAVKNISLNVDQAKIRVEKLLHRKGEWHCRGVNLFLPPDTFRKVAHLSPYLDPIPWENQIDLSGDFSFGSEGISALGTIKEGYYWIGGQSLFLEKGAFSMQRSKLFLDLTTSLRELPIQLIGEIDCAHHFRTQLNLKTDRDLEGLKIVGDWKNGPMIERVEGEFSGQKAHFIGANIPEELDAIALSGNIHLDIPQLLPLLPLNVQKNLQKMELTGGYELSGDLILDRTKPLDAIFQGFLKGRYFGLSGNQFKTLLSEIEITQDRIFLRDFNLSDEAILMKVNHALFSRKEKDWHFFIPKIAVQDFRPSLMRKNHRHEKRMKPFTIRKMAIEKLEGSLGDPHTITGRGSLHFINTFKRSNNLLDIPIEIISRLGLDQSILIPVMGDIDFVFEDGEMQLVKLDNCFSEGRHSRFSLSKNRHSYIGLDGSIHVDIRMKQHVLLRFTQPFMLSLRGTLAKPRYSLKG
ncbi:MAG: hypothetical protein SNF33_00515 [Candidatus Algichlamydia australiensis]|nr:hypothetical protein [Chlamydiales bacterium]